MKIGKIDHVAINCRDLGKSLDFYGRILGLKQLQTVDCGDFDITYFALPGGGRLELFDYRGQNRSPDARRKATAGCATWLSRWRMWRRTRRSCGPRASRSRCRPAICPI